MVVRLVPKERVTMNGTTPPPLTRAGAWSSSGPPNC